MQRLTQEQMLSLAFSRLETAFAIFSTDAELLTSNAKYQELLRHYAQQEGATFPFDDAILNDLRSHLDKADDIYRLKLTIDPFGHSTTNVFAGDTFRINAQRITDGESHVGTVLTIEESNEDARKGDMLDEFLLHRGLILDNTNGGLVYMTPDYRVLWKRLLNLYDDHFDHMYQEGTCCYESYGRSEPCGDCPMKKSMKTHRVEKELREMDDGTFIETIAIPVMKGHELEGYIIHMSDVTERETMLETLREARDSVIESERLEEAFINNMNHEIRTPLNAIIGFNDLLNGVAGEHMEEDEKRMMKDHINKNADRLITLINDILDLSKMETGKLTMKKTVVNLIQVCCNARDAVRPLVPKGVELKHEYPVYLQDLRLYTDGKRLEQLIRNVLSNACKHTKEGSITLSVRSFETEQKKPMLEIAITDTGTGIPQDKADQLFTPFRKVHDHTQGLGMGLAICRQIAKMLGGHIYHDERYTGRGSRFVFEMPLEDKMMKQ